MVSMITRDLPPLTATSPVTGAGTTTLEPVNINTYLTISLTPSNASQVRSVTMSKACHDAADIGDRVFLLCVGSGTANTANARTTVRITVPTIVDEQGGGSVTWDIWGPGGCQVGVAGGTNVNLLDFRADAAGGGRDTNGGKSTWTLMKMSGVKWVALPGLIC